MAHIYGYTMLLDELKQDVEANRGQLEELAATAEFYSVRCKALIILGTDKKEVRKKAKAWADFYYKLIKDVKPTDPEWWGITEYKYLWRQAHPFGRKFADIGLKIQKFMRKGGYSYCGYSQPADSVGYGCFNNHQSDTRAAGGYW